MANSVDKTAAAGRNGKGPRVLIVDDDPTIRMLCSTNLQMEGLLVLEAGDGKDALQQARHKRPDLVVTDVMMPGMDGFQLAAALRSDERTRRIPLIFLSGEAGLANPDRAQELGALAYFSKPFDAPAFSSLVARVLGLADRGGQISSASPRPRVARESPLYLH